MMQIRFLFGRRQSQDLPGYPSGPIHPFLFTIFSDAAPVSWHSAYALLGFYRHDFIKACRAAGTSSEIAPIEGREIWIPTCYLERPTIELLSGGGVHELLCEDSKPNPWLSLAH